MKNCAKKFIVPPGLKHLIKEFEAHVDIAEGEPIMICGPSGAGKSLFLHILKNYVRKSTARTAASKPSIAPISAVNWPVRNCSVISKALSPVL